MTEQKPVQTQNNPSAGAESAAQIVLPAGAITGLSLAAFTSGVSMRVTDPLLPRLAGDFSLTVGHASLVITVFSVAYGISQLVFGPLGDRFGKYRVIAWGTMACALATAVCAMATNFEWLLAGRALAGSMAAAIIPLAMAWIGDVVPYQRRQTVLARFLIGQIMGVSAGVLLGGYAADHLHWRAPFVVIAAMCAVVGVFLFWIRRRMPAAALKCQRSEGSAIGRMVREFGLVLSVPWARVVLLTVFAEGALVFGAFAFMVTHLHQVHGLALAQAGQIVMLFGFGGFLFAIGAHYLVHRLGEAGLCRWGGGLLLLSYSFVAWATSWWYAMPACFLAGLGFYMVHNTLQINATQMAPERRGAAVAAFAACYFIGQSAGIAVSSVLLSRLGTSGVIALCGVGVLLVALNFARLLGLRRRI